MFGSLFWIIFGLSLNFLFTDSWLKWLFHIFTVLNITLFVLIISYILSRNLPYPMYANTGIRIIFYSIFIFLFKNHISSLYHQVVDRWAPFLFISLGILSTYLYILLGKGNIEDSITENSILLLLFSTLVFFVYITIFWSFGNIIREYELLNAQEQAKLHENLISSQLLVYEEFVTISKHQRHDLRHHNQILMEYLEKNDLRSAREYLNLYDTNLIKTSTRDYSENPIANAILRIYTQKSHEEKIAFTSHVDIQKNHTISQPELGSLLSNILENALESCRKVNVAERIIFLSAEIEDNNLKIELKNSANNHVEIRDDLPVSTKEGGGIGMKSVKHIVESNHGMIFFKQEPQLFITQIILPV